MDYYAIYGKKYLAHHGILGQKWGQRNGPPYPLKDEDHSKAEKEAEKKFHLSDEQKKYLKIGLAAVGVALATYGVYKLSKTDMVRSFINRGKNKVDSLIKETMSGYTTADAIKLNDKEIIDAQIKWDKQCENAFYKDLKDVPIFDTSILYRKDGTIKTKLLMKNNNPDYENNLKRQFNCPFSSASIIMRLKGYYVKSDELHDLKDGWPSLLFTDWFKGSQQERVGKTKSELINTLKSGGNGSYGILDVKWLDDNAGRHGIPYIVQKDSVIFLDGEKSKKFKTDALMSIINIERSCYYRLDQCDPTNKVLGALAKV